MRIKDTTIENKSPWEIGVKSLFSPKENKRQRDLNYEYFKPTGSYQLVSWMFKYSNLKRHARLIALEIAAHYNPKKGYAWPTYEMLMKETGMKERTINNAIQEMKLSGEWLVVPIAVNSYARAVSNRYYPLTPISQDSFIKNHELYNKKDDFNQDNKWVPAVTHENMKAYYSFKKQLWKGNEKNAER